MESLDIFTSQKRDFLQAFPYTLGKGRDWRPESFPASSFRGAVSGETSHGDSQRMFSTQGFAEKGKQLNKTC